MINMIIEGLNHPKFIHALLYIAEEVILLFNIQDIL